MARVYWVYGEQFMGKTMLLASAAPPVPEKKSLGSCLFSPSAAVRQQVQQTRGFTPISVVTTLHGEDFPVDWWQGAGNRPYLVRWIDDRVGSIEKPPVRALKAGAVIVRDTNAKPARWTVPDAENLDPAQVAGVAAWKASAAYWREKGYSTTERYFWAPPGSAEGELAGLWTPHSSVCISDWQRIQMDMERWRGFVKISAADDAPNYMNLGTELTPLIMRILRWFESSPLTVFIDSHPRSPGTRMGSSDVAAGGPWLPTREGAKQPISTLAMAVYLTPANVEITLESARRKSGAKLAEGEAQSAAPSWSIDDLVANTVVTLPHLSEAGFTSVLRHFPSSDPLRNVWLTRDRENVLWPGGCPGALYGLYAGAGKASSYPCAMYTFIERACLLAAGASKIEEVYKAVGAAMREEAGAAEVAGLLAGLDPVEAEARRYSLTVWALQEATAAFTAAARSKSKMSGLMGMMQ